ncbi:putative ABC-class ATPase [Actinokineospora baliensis]|uniref:PE domain-containing protein n=1 Tax=Actinokineospora baliensis TaxID=547056 RepID=UPI0019570415|nr:PE domain-containing protein [Actinokineospora baliensis]MBM7771498.1 putative ABC-class ATPase [Actinokineospora baliensis]
MPEDDITASVDRQISVQVGSGAVRRYPDNVATSEGASGYFHFESLAALDALIARWHVVLAKISANARTLEESRETIRPPAGDEISTNEVTATKRSVQSALDHNIQMQEYTRSYLEKLIVARNEYAATEARNTVTVRASKGG